MSTPLFEKIINNQQIILNELFPQKTEYEGSFITAENCVEGLYGKVKTDEETEITVCNKNLIDTDNLNTGMLSTSTGKLSPSVSSWRSSGYIGFDISQSFVFSWTSNNNFLQVNFYFYDKDKNYLGYYSNESWAYNKKFDFSENEEFADCKYIRISYSTYVDSTAATRENIQLEYGTSKTDYVEHQEQNLTGTNIDFKCYDDITHIYNTNDINMTATIRTK